MPHYVYIIRCVDGSLYTGMTGNLSNRFTQHKNGQGAVWTKRHGVETLLCVFQCKDGPSARKLEVKIKRMGREQKLDLCSSPKNLVIPSKTR